MHVESTDSAHYRLRSIRMQLGLTQHEMAERLEITRNHYAFMEQGRRNISNSILDKLNEGFGISASWLLYGQGHAQLPVHTYASPAAGAATTPLYLHEEPLPYPAPATTDSSLEARIIQLAQATTRAEVATLRAEVQELKQMVQTLLAVLNQKL